MEFLSGSNPLLLHRLQELGYDPEALYYISKDFFNLCVQLGFNSRQTADMFVKIKEVHEAIESGGQVRDLALFESNRYNPLRLSVMKKSTGSTIFFKMIPGQSVTEKKNILYTCETCANEMCIKRCEAKDHFEYYHS